MSERALHNKAAGMVRDLYDNQVRNARTLGEEAARLGMRATECPFGMDHAILCHQWRRGFIERQDEAFDTRPAPGQGAAP